MDTTFCSLIALSLEQHKFINNYNTFRELFFTHLLEFIKGAGFT